MGLDRVDFHSFDPPLTDTNDHNDINLSSAKVFKDHGIFIDKELKWNHHISYLYRIALITSF